MIWHNAAGALEPEICDPREYGPLAWNRLRQDYIERRQAISRHDQQVVVVDFIDVPYLATMNQFQRGKCRVVQGAHGSLACLQSARV